MASGVRCCMSSFLVSSGAPRRTDPVVINSCRRSVTQTLTSPFFKTRFCPSHLSSASAFGCSKKFRVSIRDFGMRHVILAQLEERPLDGFEVSSDPAFVESASFRELESKGYTVEHEEILGGGGGIEVGLGSGGNGDGGKNWNNHGGESEEGKGNEGRKKMLLMSQKFTLAYAALVGASGVAGFIKVGSKKSLAAGGLSALLLFFVYLQLPSSPVFASSVGLGVSVALLTVMGSRFKASGKVFPAGVVSLVSLIMTGGYFHGIMRSMRT